MNAMSSTAVMTSKTMTSSAGPAVRPKRVEVRWLESESELYLKQWQHRYHQLVGLENSYYRLNGSNGGQDFDDFLCLDLDIDFDSIDANCNQNHSNAGVDNSGGGNGGDVNHNLHHKRQTIAAFDHIFWTSDEQKINNKNKRFKNTLFSFADNPVINKSLSLSSGAEEDIDGYVVQRSDATDDGIEGSAEESVENFTFNAIKRFVNNNKIKANNNRNKKDSLFNEKERQFSIDLNKRLEILAKDQALAAADDPALKSRQPKSRQRDRTRPPRPRPPPIRRQIFKCEHIGCSYQSDRNFNFLRHKRTHRKTKPDENTGAEVPATTAAAQPITQSLAVVNQNNTNNTYCNQELSKNTSNTSITASINTSIAATDAEHTKPSPKTSISCDRSDDNNENHFCDDKHSSYHPKLNVCLLMSNQ